MKTYRSVLEECTNCGTPLRRVGAACRACRPGALRPTRLIALQQTETLPTTQLPPTNNNTITVSQQDVAAISGFPEQQGECKTLEQVITWGIARGFTVLSHEPQQAILQRKLKMGSDTREYQFEMLCIAVDAAGKIRLAYSRI